MGMLDRLLDKLDDRGSLSDITGIKSFKFLVDEPGIYVSRAFTDEIDIGLVVNRNHRMVKISNLKFERPNRLYSVGFYHCYYNNDNMSVDIVRYNPGIRELGLLGILQLHGECKVLNRKLLLDKGSIDFMRDLIEPLVDTEDKAYEFRKVINRSSYSPENFYYLYRH